MRYLLAIHGNESQQANATPEEQGRIWKAYLDYTNDLRAAGAMLGGDPLLPTATGAKVQLRAGKRTVVDGPFTEAKEVLGGYYVIEAKSLQEACEWAARCPGAQHGTMEVRQILELTQGPK